MDNLVYKNEKLSKYSWFGLGGFAKIFFKPKSALDLKKFLEKYNKKNKKIHILGAGSNTLFRDSGFNGVIIKLGAGFNYIKLLNNNKIEVGAATLDKKLSDFAKQKSITGFEFLSCIPGSIGGAITMNSGCYDYDISQIFFSLKGINFSGNLKSFNKDDVKFFYRGNNLPKDLIILSAVFEGGALNKREIESRQMKLINQKKESQPNKIKTCGSTFKNPQDKKAWKLIRSSNCSNLNIGGARMSSQHSNFFLNNGSATSSDIENLIEEVRKKVFLKTGINLELEIKIIGEK
ncbi:MAG: UDP-N-acetylmuramate dehydrogenase [Pelagibacteraceae bacterium]|nr:UDP-N-acetylmuramate dehydrogenase [Pelagibacteraceae bacterium]MBO6482559.1 UDP-N-acetylmuramate dehydrogenase [Pelagibacteraceae bacterium]MBO6483211.1 UDP-N-acetylmuramate dehydrogenase [Pelagibacteraceae bacterium]MBO6484215.1 UDP-N-acetylmuramate dehydrogenase [Pelagibacteraceae bacterium]MBO6487313.1 UDP-N-acetylmuramate dehydrogenase [Pelagibacteraceae bacterium]